MPNVAGREFPYTPQGMAAAEQYKQSLGMRGGGIMGFRPVGYAHGTGPAGVYPAFQRYKDEIRELSDIELAERVAHEDVLSSFRTPEQRQYTFSDKELMDAGYGPRIRTRARAIPESEEYMRRKDSAEDPKTSLIRKYYFEALKNITDTLPTQSPEIQRNIDKGMAEAYPGGYSKPMLSPYEGTYELPEDPDIPWTTETRDLYRGGGYPGPSFIPTGDQTAPDFEQPLAGGGYVGGSGMGFRPLGYRDGGDVEAANDATYSKLQTALATLKDKEQLNNFIHENKAALESMAEASSARRETLESIKHFSNFTGFMERIKQESEEPPPTPLGLGDRTPALGGELLGPEFLPEGVLSETLQGRLQEIPIPGRKPSIGTRRAPGISDIDIYRRSGRFEDHPGVDRRTGDYYPPSGEGPPLEDMFYPPDLSVPPPGRRHGGIMSLRRR